ncbi:MAG: hypothetical protein H6733_10255 [Alphaproteobacteria bacterium]|nr:hypothetical protein [Alphaproteobacteria bacterium]
MRPVEAVIVWPGRRPGLGWHAHGTTVKHLWVLHGEHLARVQLRKPRWRHVETGVTRHDRPIWDVPGSPYGLDVVFTVVFVWLSSAVGLLRTDWPWDDDLPSRRSVQRWTRRLTPEADAWLRAIRLAAIELAAPRPLEEYLPTGGIPPPAGRSRRNPDTATAWPLHSSAWILKEAARALCKPIRTLLVEARRRWSSANPGTD